MSKQVDWPSFQSFREDGVIGVGTRAHTDVPGLDTSKSKYASKYFTVQDYETR